MQAQGHVSQVDLYDLWKAVVKRRKFILGLFLVSVISAVVISFQMPKIYRGEAIVMLHSSTGILAKDLPDFIGKIDLDKKRKLLPNTFSSITSVKFNFLRESKDKIVVLIESSDINAIPQALLEIAQYINTINSVKMGVKEEQERLQNRSTELSKIIKASSDMLDTYSQLLKKGKLVPVGFNPVELNKRIADIKLEKLIVDQSIERFKGGVEVAKQIDINSKPVKPSKRNIVVLSGILSIVGGIVLAIFFEYVKKLKNAGNAE